MSAVVLNVDDSFDDVLLLKRACRKADAQFTLHFAEDGEFAIDYMLGRGPFADRAAHPLPNFILLDLKMPRKDGFEVLNFLKTNPQFRDIPVAIFTSSTHEEDIRRAVGGGADCYLAKPLDYAALIVLMKRLNAALRESGASLQAALAKLPECRATAGKCSPGARML